MLNFALGFCIGALLWLAWSKRYHIREAFRRKRPSTGTPTTTTSLSEMIYSEYAANLIKQTGEVSALGDLTVKMPKESQNPYLMVVKGRWDDDSPRARQERAEKLVKLVKLGTGEEGK